MQVNLHNSFHSAIQSFTTSVKCKTHYNCNHSSSVPCTPVHLLTFAFIWHHIIYKSIHYQIQNLKRTTLFFIVYIKVYIPQSHSSTPPRQSTRPSQRLYLGMHFSAHLNISSLQSSTETKHQGLNSILPY